jgi:hypothetical protein
MTATTSTTSTTWVYDFSAGDRSQAAIPAGRVG